ncbi:MAG: hypothetical protein AAFY00_03680, partial [Bacteroidota bacterium]
YPKKLLRYCLVVPFLGLFISCKQNTFDTEQDLWAYIKDEANGYTYQKKVGNVLYSLTYRPTDVLVKQELGENLSQDKVSSLRSKYQEYIYFNLSMSANNQELLNTQAGDRNAFGAMVNELAFGMADKVHLYTQSKDTIPMVDYIYPRMYGMSGSTNLLLIYPRDKELLSQEFFHFSVEDLGFRTGEIRFKLPTKPFKSEPMLKLKTEI